MGDEDDGEDEEEEANREGKGGSYLSIRGGQGIVVSRQAGCVVFHDRHRCHRLSSSSNFEGGRRKAIGLGAMTIIKDLQSTTVAFKIRKHGQEEG